MDCPRCANPIEAPALALTNAVCTQCHLPYIALCGAPLPVAAELPDAALADNAVCFFHERNAAHGVCQRCGRIVCRLCQIAIEGETLCPPCFERGREQATLSSVRQSDFLYDSLALLLGGFWWVFWPSWFAALPVVVWLTWRRRRAPRGYLIPRSAWRFAAAWVGLLWLPVVIVVAVAFRWLARH